MFQMDFIPGLSFFDGGGVFTFLVSTYRFQFTSFRLYRSLWWGYGLLGPLFVRRAAVCPHYFVPSL